MPELRTAPQLFAVSRGVLLPDGDSRCFYCGGECGEDFPASRHVKGSFTGRDTVAGGDWVCAGCVAAMDEKATINMPDGTQRTGQKVRCYSWVLSGDAAVAATKSYRPWLTETCLHPPAPPFIICLSDSGQKHLLYRAVLCHALDLVRVTLEAEVVSYRPDELEARLLLCRSLVGAVGKPALSGALSASLAMRVWEACGEQRWHAWQLVCRQPLTRLALWLCPSKQECAL